MDLGKMNRISCTFSSSKGERVEIDLTAMHNGRTKRDILRLWYKNGHTISEMDSCWNMNTYVYTPDGNCVSKYNPTIRREDNRSVIDFNWALEATPENAEKLIAECRRLAEV